METGTNKGEWSDDLYTPSLAEQHELIDLSFVNDYELLLKSLLHDIPVHIDLMNADLVLSAMRMRNKEWHYFYGNLNEVWCRTSEIKKLKDLSNFKKDVDYFMSKEGALAYIHGQLRAHGHEVTELRNYALKRLDDWKTNEAEERERDLQEQYKKKQKVKLEQEKYHFAEAEKEKARIKII